MDRKAVLLKKSENVQSPFSLFLISGTTTALELFLGSLSPVLKQWIGIAGWLGQSLENQIASGPESRRMFEVFSHLPICRIISILLVDHGSHSLQGIHDLRDVGNAVTQPAGDVLARYTQRCTVFHQGDVTNVRHFGAADTLIDPAT